MQSRRLTMWRSLGVVTLLLALSALPAAARAEEVASWTVEGSRLEPNQIVGITIKADELIDLQAPGVEVLCKGAAAGPESYLQGAATGEPGTIAFSVELTKCEVSGNGEKCKVSEPFITKQMRGELVYNDEEGKAGRKVFVELDPAAGTEATFGEIKFDGEGCTVKSTELKNGLLLGRAFNQKGEQVTGSPPEFPVSEARALKVEFPDTEKTIYLAKGGENKIFELKPAEIFGAEAKVEGALSIEVVREPCKSKKEKWVFCNAAGYVMANAKFEGSGGTTTLDTPAMEMECSTSHLATVEILFEGKSSSKSETYTKGCVVVSPSTCSVSSEFVGKTVGELVGSVREGQPEEELVGEGKGEEITSLGITGCSLEGTYPVTGRQKCRYASEYETAQEAHEFTCTGNLKFDGETAKFERSTTDYLVSKASWSIRPN
jgi:hypothetical protein